jgi:dTDP-4-dehydrorhamnose reductase
VTKYLIAGGGGMLATDLAAQLASRDVVALTRAQLDITDAAAVRDAAMGFDVVINAAAYTKVDDAETHEDEAHLINAVGAGNLARAAHSVGARLVQISTDYVFDGTATTPYAEDAPLNPVSAYGRTKADGERLVLEENGERSYIVRTAWLYGTQGPNFAKTMRRLAGERDQLTVVGDQMGQPTYTGDLAAQIITLLDSDAPAGIYHGTNSGEASWFDFARAIFVEAGLDPERIHPTDSAAFARPAPRPAYSVLGHAAWTAAGIEPMRYWRDALADAAVAGATRP